jgi:squalene synthase HpnC
MSVGHYENFPVASVLLPRALRTPVAHIYWFARSADDIADEGDASAEKRLQGLEIYREELRRIGAGQPAVLDGFNRLADTIRAHRLPLQPFFDLLDAFAQDVRKKRYADFVELLDYCRRSADPVGRLMLHLYGAATPENLRHSDVICSALQLINFWQDIAIDWQKGRVYLPQADLRRFGVDEAQIEQGECNAAWRELLRFEVARSRAMLESGAPLALGLPGRIGWELRMVLQGGLRILEKIDEREGDVFRRRPVLRAWDWPLMFGRALLMKTT